MDENGAVLRGGMSGLSDRVSVRGTLNLVSY